MNENVYNKFIKKILSEINENEKVFNKAITTELNDYGHKVDLEYIKAVLKNGENVLKISELENKNIAVAYNGDIEVTIQMILFALKNNLKINFFAESYEIINTCLFTLILEIMKDSKIENIYLDYDLKYDENYLRNHQEDFDKIVYIGEPFEYQNFKYFINKDVFYYNYKSYKIYIDQAKYLEEYKEFMKYAYMQNISLDVYDDIDDFVENVLEIDRVVIYTDDELEKNNIIGKLKTKEIICNEFPYDEYRFKINDLMVKLV